MIWSSNDPPASEDPDFAYEWEWPLAFDTVNTQTSHTMGFQFLGIREIKYQVALRHQFGAREPIFDIDYKATSGADSYFEDLLVTTF